MSDSLIKILEALIIMFGMGCVSLSMILAYRFKRVKAELSRALSYQLIGEAIVGFVTVAFALTSWLDMYSSLDPQVVLLMRIVIFGTAAGTSINLYRKVKQTENNVKD